MNMYMITGLANKLILLVFLSMSLNVFGNNSYLELLRETEAELELPR
jgi:hypothetical protein